MPYPTLTYPTLPYPAQRNRFAVTPPHDTVGPLRHLFLDLGLRYLMPTGLYPTPTLPLPYPNPYPALPPTLPYPTPTPTLPYPTLP